MTDTIRGTPPQEIWTVDELARMIGWNRRRTHRWLRRAGVSQKRHGRWIVTRERLKAEFPEIWDACCRRYLESLGEQANEST